MKKIKIMKKLVLILALALISSATFAQEQLTSSFQTDNITHWDKDLQKWGPWGPSNATFEIYKNNGKVTRVVAYFDPTNNYQIGTTFYAYSESTANEDNGFSYYIYVYTSNNVQTDYKLYIKLKDQIRENQTTIRIIGYQNDDWCWSVKQ